jgi:glycosyltransferase involved in cell wall biosynthesis
MTPHLYYAGLPGEGCGWGICNKNLIAALKKHVRVLVGNQGVPEDCSVFMPLADHGFNPIDVHRGRKNLAYTFFEYELGPDAKKNAKKYDTVFCGSTWCLTRMMDKGITNGRVLVQGVDQSIFYPKPLERQDGEFWIFSGGKFEYRKGQDLVLAAFKEINRKYPETRLVTAWRNPWPQLHETMRESKEIKYSLVGRNWKEQLGHLCRINGINDRAVKCVEDLIPNAEMADIYRACDVGLFPNRCEGGTNLVAMEFMACGRPIVTHSLTGHADIWNPGMMLYLVGYDHKTFWAKSKVEDIVAALERAIKLKDSLPSLGLKAADAMKQWTWERAAKEVVSCL